jgi:hypothetical protein
LIIDQLSQGLNLPPSKIVHSVNTVSQVVSLLENLTQPSIKSNNLLQVLMLLLDLSKPVQQLVSVTVNFSLDSLSAIVKLIQQLSPFQ